jgi:hypothetical protein
LAMKSSQLSLLSIPAVGESPSVSNRLKPIPGI